MDCSICKTAKVILKDSSSTGGVAVCNPCYSEFNRMMNKNNISESTRYSANWGTASANRWIEEVNQVKEEMKKREDRWVEYFGGLASALKEESYSDIEVKPGSGPSIPAHKFMLATRSEELKKKLSTNTCEAAPIDSISLPEFNHEELATFLELLYCGNLAKEKFEMHYYRLALACHKYKIPHLQKFCEEHILELLDAPNALKVWEISKECSNETLRVAAMESILCHLTEITSSPSFSEFTTQNPHLLVQFARYCCSDKSKKQKI